MDKLMIPDNLDVKSLGESLSVPSGFSIDKVHFVCDGIYRGLSQLDEETLQHPYKNSKYFVPLSSLILAHILGDSYYKNILKWMVSAGIIESDNQYIKDVVSMGYRLTSKYRNARLKVVGVQGIAFSQKSRYHFESKCAAPVRTAKTISKWFEGLTIDKEVAEYAVEWQYMDDKAEMQPDECIIRRNRYMATVADFFNDSKLEYSRDVSGWRMHTLVTRLPRKLRGLVTYGGEPLAQTDIVNSQLFCLLYLFNPENWTKDRKRPNHKIWSELDLPSLSSLITMLFKSSKSLDWRGFHVEKFIQLVTNGELYQYLVDKMSSIDSFFEMEDSAERKKHVKKLLLAQMNANFMPGETQIISFSRHMHKRKPYNYREDMRHRALFTGNKGELWNCVKSDFPHVYQIFKQLKQNDYRTLSMLLTRVESYGMIDVVAKSLTQNFPRIPIFTLHDCIVAPERHIDMVDHVLKSEMTAYIGYTPMTEITQWSEYRSLIPADPVKQWLAA